MSYSCAEWRGDIGAYIVGALDSHARIQVSRHLAACDSCRADYDDLVPVRAWLGLLPLPAPPEPGSTRQQPAQSHPDPRSMPAGCRTHAGNPSPGRRRLIHLAGC